VILNRRSCKIKVKPVLTYIYIFLLVFNLGGEYIIPLHFPTACVDLPEDAFRLLANMPKLLWQCNGCVVSNDSYSKIDELMEELHDLKSLYMDLNSKFLKAFPISTTDNSNVRQRRKVVKPLAPASSVGRQANLADQFLLPPGTMQRITGTRGE